MRLVHEFIPVRSRTNNQQNQLNLSLSVSSPPIIPQFAAAPRPDGHTPCVRPTATQNENSLRSNSLALPQQRILFGIFSSYHKITVRMKSQPAYTLRQDQLDLQDYCPAGDAPPAPKNWGTSKFLVLLRNGMESGIIRGNFYDFTALDSKEIRPVAEET